MTEEIAMVFVTKEPKEWAIMLKEDCVKCGAETAYWANKGEYPLCLKCAKSPDKRVKQ